MSVAIIQARFSSTRLPGKVLEPLGSSTVLGWTVRAAQTAGCVQTVVVATSTDSSDDQTADAARTYGAHVVRGPLDDVLSRYILAADQFPADNYVRLTADCPLLDPALVDACVALLEADPLLDLTSNAIVRSYPRGLDVEVFRASSLAASDQRATGYHRVHVTTWMTDHPEEFNVAAVVASDDASDLRVTIDTREDLAVVRAVVNALGDGPFSAHALITWLRSNPSIAELNSHVSQKRDDEG